jgi:hypothetical protein
MGIGHGITSFVPTPPGTIFTSKSKDEHYRRLAYSNKHFASKRVGWRTDRGRIFIVYGPPDEIESRTRPATEEWRFKHIDGIGENVEIEFADRAGTGEYRIVRRPPGMK